jgi:hypothetical protein
LTSCGCGFLRKPEAQPKARDRGKSHSPKLLSRSAFAKAAHTLLLAALEKKNYPHCHSLQRKTLRSFPLLPVPARTQGRWTTGEAATTGAAPPPKFPWTAAGAAPAGSRPSIPVPSLANPAAEGPGELRGRAGFCSISSLVNPAAGGHGRDPPAAEAQANSAGANPPQLRRPLASSAASPGPASSAPMAVNPGERPQPRRALVAPAVLHRRPWRRVQARRRPPPPSPVAAQARRSGLPAAAVAPHPWRAAPLPHGATTSAGSATTLVGVGAGATTTPTLGSMP